MQRILSHNSFYIAIIIILWLALYTVNQLAFGPPQLLWDDLQYLTVAKGITTDLDFSARQYTIMGLLKYGYPAHLVNFPIFSSYLAIFMTIFGENLRMIYFSSWLAGLGTAIVIYFITLILSNQNRRFSGIVATSFFFIPGIMRHLDTAMMEPLGMFLLALSTLLVLKEYQRGKFNLLTAVKFTLILLVLWLFKTIFLGFLVGMAALIIVAYREKLSGNKIETSLSLPGFLFSMYGLFIMLFTILQKYVFLPVVPYWVYTPKQHTSQVYADPLGGFFNNFPQVPLENIWHFFSQILPVHLIYPGLPSPYKVSFMFFATYYFFLLAAAILLTIAFWKKLSPAVRIFSILAITSLLIFNASINILTITVHENIHRYNMNYFPLFLCFTAIILKTGYAYLKPFTNAHLQASRILLLLFAGTFYLPLLLTNIVHQVALDRQFQQTAALSATVTWGLLKGHSPRFIYHNRGIHEPFILYPTRLVSEEATNKQLIRVNAILPEPIEFLFLKPEDLLYKNNKEQILKHKPIVAGRYRYFGSFAPKNLEVYRLSSH